MYKRRGYGSAGDAIAGLGTSSQRRKTGGMIERKNVAWKIKYKEEIKDGSDRKESKNKRICHSGIVIWNAFIPALL